MLLFVPVSNIRNFKGERKSSGFISQNVKIIAMKSGIILSLIGGVLLSSCSVYRSGQTPDDVYYSPARQTKSAAVAGNEYVQTQSGRNDGRRNQDYSNSRSYSAYDDFATMDDRWLMMRVRNPYRWSMFDDYSYYNAFSPYSPYGMGGFHSPYSSMGFGYSPGWSFGLGFGSFSPWGFGGMGYGYYNNYNNWNNYYNPYYPGVIIVDPKTNPSGYTRARSFNLNSYNNFNSPRTGTVRPQYNNTNSNRIRYNNSNNSTLGGSQRRYSNGNSEYYSSPSNNSSPSRSYSPSNNNNSYSPSSNSGGGGSYGGGNSGGSGGSGSRPSRR